MVILDPVGSPSCSVAFVQHSETGFEVMVKYWKSPCQSDRKVDGAWARQMSELACTYTSTTRSMPGLKHGDLSYYQDGTGIANNNRTPSLHASRESDRLVEPYKSRKGWCSLAISGNLR